MSIFDSELLQNYTSECCFMNLAIVDDDYGGYERTWTEGASFSAVITENLSQPAVVAGIENKTTFFGVKVEKDVPLVFNSVFKRKSDGLYFRIRNADAMESPSASPLNMKVLNAEEYKLTGTIEEKK